MDSIDAHMNELCLDLLRGPSVLFLGQETLRKGETDDLFLRTVASKFGLVNIQNYHDLISTWPAADPERLFATLQSISEHILVTDWLKTVAEVPWNTVFTTSIDEVVDRGFKTDWRDVDAILNDRRSPENPRNRRHLHVFKLYGCVTSNKPEEQPASTKLTLMQRQVVAQRMITDLATLVTPEGTLVIDGLGMRDWLILDTLLMQIASLGKNQAHWFSASIELRSHAGVEELVSEGKLVLHDLSLAELIAWGKGKGLFRAGSETHDDPEGISLTLGRGTKPIKITFDQVRWRHLVKGIPVLDDTVCKLPPSFTSGEERYVHFRRFLYGTRGMPNWVDYSRRFPFRRPVFNELLEVCRQHLAKARYNPEPVLVCGQSGVGKSVALADLAYQVRLEHWPVIYLGRTYIRTRVDFRKLDEVCESLESLENLATLIVWDGLQEVDEYAELASFLAGRGRKTLVVGSSYRIDYKTRHARHLLEFKADMSQQEQEAFRRHLKDIEPGIDKYTPAAAFGCKNFLAALYRILPETRSSLRSGLLREYAYKEERLQTLDDKRRDDNATTEIGWFANLVRQANPDWFHKVVDETEKIPVLDNKGVPASRMYRLSGLILVPGRFGLDVPIDLVLRCMGAEGFQALRTALREEDIYTWIEDDQGNYLVGARQSLEARLICDGRFTADNELSFIRTLVINLRLPTDWQRSNSEVEFVYRLLRLIGPDGDYHDRFAQHFERVFESLEQLRERNANRSHPRLLELEGHLRREYLRDLDERARAIGQAGTERVTAISHINKARDALLKAEEIVLSAQHSQRKYANLLSTLHTELASLFGTSQVMNRNWLISETDPARVTEIQAALASDFQEAVDHSELASRFRSDNTHPVDVRFWVIRNRVSGDPTLSGEERLSLVSQLCEILEEEVWEQQPVRLQEQRLSLAGILEDESLRQNALAALQSMGSMAGHYLIAREKAYTPTGDFRERNALRDAIDYLNRVGPKALEDLRLLRLYLRVWWQIFGNPLLFQNERVTAALTTLQWEEYRDLLKLRLSFEQEASNLHARFCYAWALFQCKRFREAQDEFRVLDQQSLFGRYRVQKLATWCDNDGRPIPCTGTVRYLASDYDRGEVYCPNVRMEIAFKPKEFGENLRRDDPLDSQGFYITLNFRGPSADPQRFYRNNHLPSSGNS